MTDRPQIRALLSSLLPKLVPDWEFEGWAERLDDKTRLLADLGLTSVDLVDLFVGIEEVLGRKLGFHDLILVEGRYVAELEIGELIGFIEQRLRQGPQPQAHPQIRPARPTPSPATRVHLTDSDIARFRSMLPAPLPWPAVSHKNPPAVFVLSAPRSGSTLLQGLLAGHPKLFAPPELHLLWYLDLGERRAAFQLDTNRHLITGVIRAVMALTGLTIEEAQSLLERYEQERLGVLDFYRWLQGQLGDRLLVDKTPAYAYSLQVLARAEQSFDHPLYIHLVRHPGGMIRSFVEVQLERTAPFMQRHAGTFASAHWGELAWLICNQNILEHLASIPPSRQYRVYYEDLVKAPEQVLRGLCAFLGLGFEPAMLDLYRDRHQRMIDGLYRIGELSGDLKLHLHAGIDPTAADRWRQFLSEDDLSDQTRALAQQLGYRCEAR